MPFPRGARTSRRSTLDEDFLEPLSLVSFVIFLTFVLSESSEEEKNHILTCPHTYIHEHTHICTHTHISGAFAQLILKNYTSNRLREEDHKLNVWLLPQ